MELTDEQKRAVTEWARKGAGLSEIQKQLEETFGLALTYMDVRFLVIDLGLEIEDRSKRTRPDVPVEEGAGETAADGSTGHPAASGVRVAVDRIVKPGAVVSGSVTFSDGVSGAWMLDQLGRLALDTSQPGYRPGPEDMAAFQDELRSALGSKGF